MENFAFRKKSRAWAKINQTQQKKSKNSPKWLFFWSLWRPNFLKAIFHLDLSYFFKFRVISGQIFTMTGHSGFSNMTGRVGPGQKIYYIRVGSGRVSLGSGHDPTQGYFTLHSINLERVIDIFQTNNSNFHKNLCIWKSSSSFCHKYSSNTKSSFTWDWCGFDSE